MLQRIKKRPKKFHTYWATFHLVAEAAWSSRTPPKSHFFIIFQRFPRVLLKSTRFWKWAVAHDCCNRNRSTHRITIPFVSEDTYGLQEVFQRNFWLVKSIQEFFRALQVELSCSLKSFFYMRFLLISYTNFENNKKTYKNQHIRTFVIPKTICWCLRAHHALFWKD